jgi:alpha-amylase
MRLLLITMIMFLLIGGCKESEPILPPVQEPSFSWKNAIVYFLMTDRFVNGSVHNDFIAPANERPAPYQGFMGGDLLGVTKRIESRYFNQLGINAILTTPLFENIGGSVEQDAGTCYGYHGYWIKDWTSFDSRVASELSFSNFVRTAHDNGIRVIMDVVVNNTGPVTPYDRQWPDEWVRTKPKCEFEDYKSTVECTLVDNLPDIRTESTSEVDLPPFLIEKWKSEDRLEKELLELDSFFVRTDYPRRPFYYIVKWLTDYVKEYGIDGFRVDKVNHVEEEAWRILKKEAQYSFEEWKKLHPENVLDDSEFYMVGEIYNYKVSEGKAYDFGDKQVDYFDFGFDALVNFDFKGDARGSYADLFGKYDIIMHSQMDSCSLLNYISSHDDESPFDQNREKTFESATKLLLSQGGVQIYYGDESARSLTVEAEGDARLRSFMNWYSFEKDETLFLLEHWKKLGKFRRDHKSIAMGKHHKLSDTPYTFSRVFSEAGEYDKVVIALNLDGNGSYQIMVNDVFNNGTKLLDRYSGYETIVEDGRAQIRTDYSLVLLEQI